MPLNRTKGEHIEGLGEDYRTVPLSKWSDTNLWDAACREANAAFAKAGCMVAVVFDEAHVLIQEYPGQDRIAFLFNRKVPVAPWKRSDPSEVHKDLYHPVVIRLSPGLKNELVMAGRWPKKVVN
jgi:hypothetical protein